MSSIPARKAIHIPMQALGLSAIFAGTVLAGSLILRDGMLQQVAPVEGRNVVVVPAPLAPSVDIGVPHQVAPIEGLNDVVAPAPLAPSVDIGVPHQVAPIE
jgi:hypothetical protein